MGPLGYYRFLAVRVRRRLRGEGEGMGGRMGMSEMVCCCTCLGGLWDGEQTVSRGSW